MNLTRRTGYALRWVGRTLDRWGVAFQGEAAPVERQLCRARRVVDERVVVKVPRHTLIAPSATVVGDVTLEKGSSIGIGAVLRGDVRGCAPDGVVLGRSS